MVCALWALSSEGKAADPAKVTPPPNARFQLSDLLPRGFQKNPRLNISVITDVTADGKKVPVPDPAHPAYYMLLDGGLTEEGDPVAGDRAPPAEKLAQIMKSALSSAGFEPSGPGHPPTLAIFYRWGVFNSMASLESSFDDDVPAGNINPGDPAQMKNLITRAALVGGRQFAAEMLRAINTRSLGYFENRDSRTETLVSMALSDLYFIVAMAFDYEAGTKGQKKLMWVTKISTDNQGLAMGDTLPALVTSSARYFGHETNGPVIYYPRLYPGKVEIGDPTFKGYVEPTPPASSGKTEPSKK